MPVMPSDFRAGDDYQVLALGGYTAHWDSGWNTSSDARYGSERSLSSPDERRRAEIIELPSIERGTEGP